MARVSPKGIAITAAIVAGVIAASVLLWSLPEPDFNAPVPVQNVTASNVNRFMISDVFGSIYSRHQNLSIQVDFDYDRWKRGDIDSSRMMQSIVSAKSATAEMSGALEAARPPQEWQSSFGHYAGALGSYSSYLDELERLVSSGDRNPNETTLDSHRQDSNNHVELATQAVPI